MMLTPSTASPFAENLVRPTDYTLLIVDDQEETRLANQLLLESEGYRVLTAANGPEALEIFEAEQIHLVIVDYVMSGMNGAQLIQKLRQRDDETPILLQTGYSGEQPPRELLRTLNVQGYHDKLDGPDRLLLWIEVMLKVATYLTQTRALERLKGALLDALSLALHAPVQIILSHSKILLENMERPLPPSTQETVAAILAQGQTLDSLVSHYLAMMNLKSRVTHPICPR